MPEWQGPAIVLGARPFGEADAIACVWNDEEGLRRGLVRGARSRAKQGVWQAGNLVQASWVSRLDDQLGNLSAELLHPAAALAMDDHTTVLTLSACCAVAESVLPPHTPHPESFAAALRLIAAPSVPDYVRWEMVLLTELGYGLDLSICAVTGSRIGLAYISPRTGRAVNNEGAGLWKERLLKLPAFLLQDTASFHEDWYDGLRLTGYFLQRDAFGQMHHAPPQARQRLCDHVAKLADKSIQ